MLRVRWPAVGLALTVGYVAGCTDGPSPTAPPAFEIQDAVHSDGNPHFFFLPPMVSDPSAHFTDQPFDGDLDVLVEICVWNLSDNACGPGLELYNRDTGPGSETVRVSAVDEQYVVNWHTDKVLETVPLIEGDEVYRIRVLVDDRELGHADVTVAGTMRELKNVDTDESIPLLDGRTLPIKFRIEEGALASAPVLSVAVFHTCQVEPDGSAYCWGNNRQGQLGNGEVGVERFPQLVRGGHRWREVVAAEAHTCGITETSDLYCWGYGLTGQLGLGSLPYRVTEPTLVGGPFEVVRATGYHTCALAGDGTWLCWGRNILGELGTGAVSGPVPTPTPVTVGRYQQIEAGGWHTCGMDGAGMVSCWGNNTWHELGGSEPPAFAHPQPVLAGGPYDSFAIGGRHTCGLTSDGRMECWGYNVYGQIGLGYLSPGVSEATPVVVEETPGDVVVWQRMAVRAHVSCGLSATDTWYCWGWNYWGQLGRGFRSGGYSYGGAATPALVTVAEFVDLYPGGHHACGVKADGSSWCWGENQWGQLGNGGSTLELFPVPVQF